MRDTKILLRILVLYLPLPLFWALFEQQGSRWTFQATKMDGNFGFYTFKPDQMHVLNPLLVVAIVPLMDNIVYPIIAKVGINTSLRKLTLGGLLAAVAFVLSGLVELELEKSNPILPNANHGQIRLFNGFPCNYNIQSNISGLTDFKLKALEAYQILELPLSSNERFALTFQKIDGKETTECPKEFNRSIDAYPNVASSLLISDRNQSTEHFYIDNPNRSRTGTPLIRFLVSSNKTKQLLVRNRKRHDEILVNTSSTNHQQYETLSETYEIFIDNRLIGGFSMKQGSVSTIIVSESTNQTFDFNVIEIVPANLLSMLWLAPQFTVLSLGETIFVVTGIEFSYSQAPQTMKSVLQACWLLTVAMGNAILMILVEIKMFDSQAHEFFLFAILMVVDMCIFTVLAHRYKNVDSIDDHDEQIPLKSIE